LRSRVCGGAGGVQHAGCVDPERTEAVNAVIANTIAIAIVGATLFAVVFYLFPRHEDPPDERTFDLDEWLRDKPHPDEQGYPPHRSLRVVREAPEREDVDA
jgi:hypothetical protein